MNLKDNYYNLTHPQKRVWFSEGIYSESALNHIVGTSSVDGEIDFERLKSAILHFVNNHDAMRLQFTEYDTPNNSNEVIQRFANPISNLSIPMFDFSETHSPEGLFNEWLDSVLERKQDFIDGYNFYFAMYKVNRNKQGYLFKVHHLITDGWSMHLLTRQIWDVYESETLPTGSSYVHFIEREKKYLNSKRFLNDKKFWLEKLGDLPKDLLCKDSRNTEGNRRSFSIDPETSDKIHNYLKSENVSVNTFFTAIIFHYLHLKTRKEDLIIGTPVMNRSGKNEKLIFGMFASTMPVRAQIDSKSTFRELLLQIQSELKQCYYHQKYPYDLLIKDMNLELDNTDQLFQISLNYYNTKLTQEVEKKSCIIEEHYVGHQLFPIQIVIKEWLSLDRLSIDFDYKVDCFTNEEIDELYENITLIIENALTNQDGMIGEVSLLDDQEYEKIIYQLNKTDSDYPHDRLIHELFEVMASINPDSIALSFGNENMTYAQLNTKANQVATILRDKGLKPNQVVGILMSHSFDLFIAILGVLKAGGAFMPMDTQWPTNRVSYQLSDANVGILIIDEENCAIESFTGEVVRMPIVNLNSKSAGNLKKVNSSSDLCYVIYTSGSTGKPKGVMVEHKGIVNYTWWAQSQYLQGNEHGFAVYSSIAFDLTLTSIFAPLISGNRSIIFNTKENSFVLKEVLNDPRVSVIKATPAHLALILNEDNHLSSTKVIIVGGEDLKSSIARQVCKSFSESIELYNEYGPTEAVVGCMIHKYDELTDSFGSVSIGKPIHNTQVYVLDHAFLPVSYGNIGEIYISGDGLARGYLNDNNLTDQKFIENPYIKGARMYRSGDLGRLNRSGLIEYIGRMDNQIKIKGYRIELREIEIALNRHDKVFNSAVILMESENGEKYLIAFILCDQTVSNTEIRRFLQKNLPEYMLPAAIYRPDQFPLTDNGKTDKEALRLLAKSNRILQPEKVAKVLSNHENRVLNIYRSVLDAEDFDIDSNFYFQGGDSIKAIQIVSRLNETGLRFKVKDILSYPTINELLLNIDWETKSLSIPQTPSKGIVNKLPITSWFFEQQFENPGHWHQSLLLELHKYIDWSIVENAIDNLIFHHDSLRLNYNEKLKYLYYNNDHLYKTDSYVIRYDLSTYSKVEQLDQIGKIGTEIMSSIQIDTDCLFKALLFDLGDYGQKILLIAHHLIIDVVSWQFILKDILSHFLGEQEGISLPSKTHGIDLWANNLASYSKSDSIQKELNFWNGVLDRQYKVNKQFEVLPKGQFSREMVTASFGRVETESFQSISNNNFKMTLNETIVSAVVVTIGTSFGLEDVVLEIESHGREELVEWLDITRTVGWFTSVYPLAFEILDDVESQLKLVKDNLRNVPNKGIGFGLHRYLIESFPNTGNSPFKFNFVGELNGFFNNEWFKVYEDYIGIDISPHNHLTNMLEINALIKDNELLIQVVYDGHQFKGSVIDEFVNSLFSNLKTVVEYLKHQDVIKFSPSDFRTVNISQTDLDNLFF